MSALPLTSPALSGLGKATWRLRAAFYAVALLTIGPVLENGLNVVLRHLAH